MHVSLTQARLACHCGTIRSAARQVTGFYDGILKRSGLSMAQYGLLSIIQTLGKGSVNALAAKAGLDRTTTSRTLRPLVKMGLVGIDRSAEDGRQRDISLTRAGKRAIARAEPLWRKAQQHFEAANGPAFTDSLRHSLHGLKFEMRVAKAPRLNL